MALSILLWNKPLIFVNCDGMRHLNTFCYIETANYNVQILGGMRQSTLDLHSDRLQKKMSKV